MTESPLYRRVYGADNPLLQYRQSWRPPSEAYPQLNYNQNAAQDLRNLFGNFFTQNAAQNYSPQYQPPQYSTYNQGTPFVNYNPNAPQQLADSAQEAAQNQILPAAAIYAATNGAAKSLVGLGSMYYPYVAAMLGATRFGAPIVNGIEKFANSPVGKAVGKVADWLW